MKTVQVHLIIWTTLEHNLKMLNVKDDTEYELRVASAFCIAVCVGILVESRYICNIQI